MTNTKVVVNNHRTWDPLYQKVKQLLADGSIGVLHSIMAHWSEGILQGGVHLFDMARLLTGSEAEWVFGYLDSGSSTFDQGANGIVHFRSGADLLLDASIGNAVPWELDIVATRGRIRIGNTLYPELWKSNQASSFGELAQHPFPGACVRDSGMVGALKDLIRAMEQDATTASSEVDGRADLEIAVAFHISDRIKRPVPLPVDDLDYVIHDRWGRR
jgi:predicted dehydrogenase